MNSRIYILWALISIAVAGCSDSKKEDDNQVHDQYALDYLKLAGTIRQNAETAMNNLNNAIRSADTVMMNKVYDEMLKTIRISVEDAKKLGPLYDDSNLKTELVNLLEFYYKIMTGPYIESLKLQKKPDSLFTDDDMLRTAQILDSIHKARDLYVNRFEGQLKKTAKENRTIIKYN